MIGGMRLGIWVHRLHISLSFFFGMYGKGCLDVLYSWVEFDIDMFIILYS